MKAQRDFLKAACIASILFFSFSIQNTYSQNKKNGEVYNPDGIELVYVEGNDSIKGFYIGKYELTQAQWKNIMGCNHSGFKGDNLPVDNIISWKEVKEFFTRLNEKTGKNYRLPTEAEWEYAYKGGSKNDTYEYAGSNNIDEVAWYWDNSGQRTHAVGTKKPNSLGIYDMTGNVFELCEYFFSNNYSKGIMRSSSWDCGASACKLTHRRDYWCDRENSDLGFRVVLLP